MQGVLKAVPHMLHQGRHRITWITHGEKDAAGAGIHELGQSRRVMMAFHDNQPWREARKVGQGFQIDGPVRHRGMNFGGNSAPR